MFKRISKPFMIHTKSEQASDSKHSYLERRWTFMDEGSTMIKKTDFVINDYFPELGQLGWAVNEGWEFIGF